MLSELEKLRRENDELRQALGRVGQLHHDLIEDDRAGRKFELSSITYVRPR